MRSEIHLLVHLLNCPWPMSSQRKGSLFRLYLPRRDAYFSNSLHFPAAVLVRMLSLPHSLSPPFPFSVHGHLIQALYYGELFPSVNAAGFFILRFSF